jgi:hypothetical protein
MSGKQSDASLARNNVENPLTTLEAERRKQGQIAREWPLVEGSAIKSLALRETWRFLKECCIKQLILGGRGNLGTYFQLNFPSLHWGLI